jgi:hypothetical protein
MQITIDSHLSMQSTALLSNFCVLSFVLYHEVTWLFLQILLNALEKFTQHMHSKTEARIAFRAEFPEIIKMCLYRWASASKLPPASPFRHPASQSGLH